MELNKRTREVRTHAGSTGRRGRQLIRGEPRGPGWLGATLIAALTGGAAALAAFLLDPARGRARRARMLDQGAAIVRRSARQAGRTLNVARSTASGSLAAARYSGGDGGQPFPDDVTLTSKVETILFRDPSVPKGSINVNVERGVVVLRGEVTDAEMRDRLAAEAGQIHGVWSVHNLLHPAGEPAEQLPLGSR
ncbi:MAG: BON domain-containing protein [Chloroflexi bacterium]|nr:BON domain-containing protein [Chloroflexota bacterium]